VKLTNAEFKVSYTVSLDKCQYFAAQSKSYLPPTSAHIDTHMEKKGNLWLNFDIAVKLWYQVMQRATLWVYSEIDSI
jgi:hypothetical protein